MFVILEYRLLQQQFLSFQQVELFHLDPTWLSYPKNKIVLITREKDEYVWMANAYAELATKRGINAKAHVVKGGHDGKLTLIKYGKEIIREALK